MKIVISDTSPIRALHHLNLLHLLRDFFGTILVPPAVVRELEQGKGTEGLLSLPEFIRVESPSDTDRVAALRNELDAGESEAIALAIEIRADLLLVDERKATRVALASGLQTIGVLGLLLRGKREGHIAAVLPCVEQLRDKLRFFVSPRILARVMQECGETP